MQFADPTIPGSSPPNPAVGACLLLTLLCLPGAGLARTWDVRISNGTMLTLVTGRERADSQRSAERFLARLARAGAAERLTEVRATWTAQWQKEHAGSDRPTHPAAFYVDGRRQAASSDGLVPRGPVGKLGGKILGCRELVVLHDAHGHPLLATPHRGDQPLTMGVPRMLHCDEQATGQVARLRVIVDREGVAAEFLAHLRLEGRQVITLVRCDQYESEQSFQPGGDWQPGRSNRRGQVICEVAPAHFAVKQPEDADPAVSVEVALLRDGRTLGPVEGVGDAADESDWHADLPDHQQSFWAEGWQAGAARPAPTTPKLLPVLTTGHGMEAVERAQTSFNGKLRQAPCLLAG